MIKRLRLLTWASSVLFIVTLLIYQQAAAVHLNYLFSVFSSGVTLRASVSSEGIEGNGWSEEPNISTDGRYITFASLANNLVPNDFNNEYDIFIHDQQSSLTKGIIGNDSSGQPVISADGRYIAFYSWATNLVFNDTNDDPDVFIYDQVTGGVELISLNSAGEQGDGNSWHPSISADGRYVVFNSLSQNLVPNDRNMKWDVFLRDRLMGTTERVSIDSAKQEANNHSYEPAVSTDGRFVAFSSIATDLTSNISSSFLNVYVHDRQQGITKLVSATTSGELGNGDSFQPDMSANGRYITFLSLASNLVDNDTNQVNDIFVYDLWTNIMERVNVSSDDEQTNGNSSNPTISADGRFVTFPSLATNLVTNDTNEWGDIFRHDRLTGVTERISLSSTGEQGDSLSLHSAISADGRFIAFQSGATNLVPNDTNNFYDIFVRDQPFATLDSNHPGGAPGSYFTLSGNYFPPTSTATITVNDLTLGDVPTDDNGSTTFLLHTTNATPGLYTIRLTVAPYFAETQLILHPANDTHPQEGNGPIFELPAGLAHHLLYLPTLTMNH